MTSKVTLNWGGDSQHAGLASKAVVLVLSPTCIYKVVLWHILFNYQSSQNGLSWGVNLSPGHYTNMLVPHHQLLHSEPYNWLSSDGLVCLTFSSWHVKFKLMTLYAGRVLAVCQH